MPLSENDINDSIDKLFMKSRKIQEKYKYIIVKIIDNFLFLGYNIELLVFDDSKNNNFHKNY